MRSVKRTFFWERIYSSNWSQHHKLSFVWNLVTLLPFCGGDRNWLILRKLGPTAQEIGLKLDSVIAHSSASWCWITVRLHLLTVIEYSELEGNVLRYPSPTMCQLFIRKNFQNAFCCSSKGPQFPAARWRHSQVWGEPALPGYDATVHLCAEEIISFFYRHVDKSNIL